VLLVWRVVPVEPLEHKSSCDAGYNLVNLRRANHSVSLEREISVMIDSTVACWLSEHASQWSANSILGSRWTLVKNRSTWGRHNNQFDFSGLNFGGYGMVNRAPLLHSVAVELLALPTVDTPACASCMPCQRCPSVLPSGGK
jgi:hypothetical protein